MDGICTLANDRVYDQLIALLNSIEANAGEEIPVCIYPYNENTERIAAEIEHRPNVTLYNDWDSIERWDQFFRDVWDAHPNAHERRREKGFVPYYRFGHHRYFSSFDGPFDRFIYMDADTLLMGPVKPVFDYLDINDWVIYDFQYKDIGHVYDTASERLKELFPPERLHSEVFCSGFYASRKNLYTSEQLEWFLEKLREGEAEVLYIWAADQPILNYMAMKAELQVCNLALQLPREQVTGCSVTSPHFQEKDGILYDRGTRLTYLHYIGVSSKVFTKLCSGENIDFPYRDIFLHYRYLRTPEQRPQFVTKPKPYNASLSWKQRILKKLGFTH